MSKITYKPDPQYMPIDPTHIYPAIITRSKSEEGVEIEMKLTKEQQKQLRHALNVRYGTEAYQQSRIARMNEFLAKEHGLSLAERYTPLCMPKTDTSWLLSNGIPIPKVMKVIFNGPVTVIIWADTTKTIVRIREDGKKKEKDDRRIAIIWAIAKRIYGSRSQLEKRLKAIKKIGAKNDNALVYALLIPHFGNDVEALEGYISDLVDMGSDK